MDIPQEAAMLIVAWDVMTDVERDMISDTIRGVLFNHDLRWDVSGGTDTTKGIVHKCHM